MDHKSALVRALLEQADTAGWVQPPKFGGYWSEDEVRTEVYWLLQAGLLEGTRVDNDEYRVEKFEYKIDRLSEKGRERLETLRLGSN